MEKSIRRIQAERQLSEYDWEIIRGFAEFGTHGWLTVVRTTFLVARGAPIEREFAVISDGAQCVKIELDDIPTVWGRLMDIATEEE